MSLTFGDQVIWAFDLFGFVGEDDGLKRAYEKIARAEAVEWGFPCIVLRYHSPVRLTI